MENQENVRIDKWLWAVRIFKTRSMATEACRAGHIKVDGQNVKPSRAVKPNEIIVARTGDMTRTLKVLAPLERRVGAKSVPLYLEDQTPPAEFSRKKENQLAPIGFRKKGAGRPTKKDRRQLGRLFPADLT